VGMPAFCPLPESKNDGVVPFGQGLLTAHGPVIVSPAPDEGIELAKQGNNILDSVAYASPGCPCFSHSLTHHLFLNQHTPVTGSVNTSHE
jgi:hypothetical protein